MNKEALQKRNEELEAIVKSLKKENKLLDRKLGDMLAGHGYWTSTGK